MYHQDSIYNRDTDNDIDYVFNLSEPFSPVGKNTNYDLALLGF